jgi:predicted dehydrogenase
MTLWPSVPGEPVESLAAGDRLPESRRDACTHDRAGRPGNEWLCAAAGVGPGHRRGPDAECRMMAATIEQPIRLGIVGCGAVARLCHLKALDTLPHYEVRYLCDQNLKTAEEARKLYGLHAEVTTKIDDFAGQVDAAIVCVWPRYHLPVTLELLRMGMDVLCEKPIAMHHADAVRIVQAAQQADRIVAVGQWCRCQINFWILRRLLLLDYLGEIQSVEATFGNILGWPMSSGAYFDRNLTAGGVTFDGGIHVLDLVVWLFGEVRQIQYQDDSYGGVEANGVITGSIEIGGRPVPCTVATSWTHELRNSVRVVGSKGQAEARFAQRDVVIVQQQVGGERLTMHMTADGMTLPFRSANPYAAQLEDFAAAVRLRRPPITPAASTLLPLQIIEQAYAVRQPMPQPWVQAGLGTSCATHES